MSLKPFGILLFIKMTHKTLKMDEIQLFYDSLTVEENTYLAGWISKLNKLNMDSSS